ncbi:PE family protein [Mycobacterium sp. UM_CSW]|uniref:PE family protein n=1 Tax=Mycobacterium sp. UM_CSW TaxID=1370119 RepID=UPI0013766281|nr:PE family protein [Mycobacterium sp. UM_CSW]
MSFVIATPDLVESATANLAGIGSSLAEAASGAAGPTTGIAVAAQDEVSIAIASIFGNFGQQFQTLNARAQAFHERFLGLLDAGAGAYASAEVENVSQVLLGEGLDTVLGSVDSYVGGAVSALQNSSVGALLGGEIQAGAQAMSNATASAPIALGTLQPGGASAFVDDLGSFGATVAAPYRALVSNTATNLLAIRTTLLADPFPFVHQLATNQVGYAQTIASSLATGIQNLPTGLAALPASVQAGIQGLTFPDPGAAIQQLVNNQITYAQTIGTGLQATVRDLGIGLAGLPATFQTAGQALAAGDVQGVWNAFAQGAENVLLPGFQPLSFDFSEVGSPTATPLPVVPLGPLGDLAPILAIPGQMAQNFTNLLPVGSIPAQISQHITNLVETVTDFGATFNPGNLAINFGLPLQVVFDGVGAPVNAVIALNSSAVAFATAVQTGDPLGAAAALIDAPAVVTNGFLNGQTLISLPPLTGTITVDGAPVTTISPTAELPLGGLLTPLSPVVLAGGLGSVPGTPIGGLIPGLLLLRSELAAAIGAHA